MKIKTVVIYVILFLTIIFTVLLSQSRINNGPKIVKINDRVLLIEYLNVNVTAVQSKNGIIIVDTHRSPATMEKIKKLIEKEFGRSDFLYVINTHGDYDHCSGNQLFPSATIIGHANCPEYMRQTPGNSPQTIWHIKSNIDDMKEAIQNPDEDPGEKKELESEIELRSQMLKSLEHEYKVTPPVKTFSDSLIIHLDDMTVKMIYCGNAHTDNDIFIYIPEEKLVFTGDLFTSKNSFGFNLNKMNDLQRVVSSMDQILRDSSGIKFVIPGHGAYFSGNDFLALRNLLKEKIEDLPKSLSAAQLLESLIVTNGITKALQIYSGMGLSKKKKYYCQEEEFSVLGNRYMRKGMLEKAIGVFTVLTKTFPNSAL